MRINSASDDPAGLSVSLALSVRSRVLSSAIRNTNDGISALSIASGTLQSQSSILTRMMELSEQSANGSFSSAQRNSLQSEYNALISELGRIGDTTEFNGVKLLRSLARGGIDILNLQIGADGSRNSALRVSMSDAGSLSGVIDVRVLGNSLDDHGTKDSLRASHGNGSTFFLSDSAGVQHAVAFSYSGGTLQYNTYTYNAFSEIYEFDNNNIIATLNSDGSLPSSTLDAIQTDIGVRLNGVRFSRMPSGPDLGGTTAIETTGIETQAFARTALDIVRQRLEASSSILGNLGAAQSRLNTVLQQAASERENVSAAASRITDTDVGQETAALTASKIRQQSSAAVLTQANQLPKLLLTLLGNT